MTFLTPVPALIAAALMVPALVALYLLKLRRRPVRVSSTLLWTAAVRDLQVNVPLRWLRASLLLLLQLVILGLFLGALARPALDLSGSAPERVILLIDRSASMGATDTPDGSTRLRAATRRAADLLAGMLRGSGDAEACVVAFASEPRAVTGFTRDLGALRRALEALEPSDQPGDLQAALTLAGTLARADAGEAEESTGPPALVMLLSDGASADERALTLAGARLRFERIGPGEGDVPDNLGIVALAARRDYEDPGVVRVFARIQNASRDPVATTVTLALDGEVVERRAIEIPGATPGAPGQAGVTLPVRTSGAAVAVVSLGRPDQLAADDAAALVLEAAARPRMILVVPDAPDSESGASWVLSDPLQELRPRSFRILQRSAYDRSAEEESGPGADLIVFDRVRPARTPSVPSISFGAGLPVPGLTVGEDPEAPGTYVVAWERSHPALRNVALDTVYVGRPLDVDLAIPPEADVAVDILARGRDGPLIVSLEAGRVRRLLVAFDAARSNWPLQVGFAIFLADAVDFLTLRSGDEKGGATYATTEAVEVPVARGATLVRIRGPREFTVPIPAGSARVSLGAFERAGVYRIEQRDDSGTSVADDVVAVNLLDAQESTLASTDRVQVAGETVEAGSGGAGPREIWPWFVLGALVLLAVEWFLNAWLMRA